MYTNSLYASFIINLKTTKSSKRLSRTIKSITNDQSNRRAAPKHQLRFSRHSLCKFQIKKRGGSLFLVAGNYMISTSHVGDNYEE